MSLPVLLSPRVGGNVTFYKMQSPHAPAYHYARRAAISSESPGDLSQPQAPFAVYPKSLQVKQELESVIQRIVMFKHLRGAPLNTVIDAMKACSFPIGHVVIQEGSMDGEDMFIIMEGQLDVFYGQTKVATIGKGRCFGEVALMYNCPRTATIVSITPVVLYALSRPVFRAILIDESIQQRARYEAFLKKVPLFQSLVPYELSRFSDALETEEFQEGQVIMYEGQVDPHAKFYIVESGSVVCTKLNPQTGQEVNSVVLREGGFFGEIALLANKPRQATVRCIGATRCLSIARDHFLMVIGPVEDILKRNMENYKSYQQLLAEESQTVIKEEP
jgi:cAMP-dependent protein kinase regulator